MFNKLLSKWKKHFKFFSPENKNVRELKEGLTDEVKSETMEKIKKSKKRRTKKMADEKEVEKKVETSKVETENNEVDKDKSTETVKETEKEVEKTDEKPVEETKKTEEETVKDEEPTAQVAEEVEPVGNGIRIEDLVTKDELAERIAAMEAKFDAVVKENNDLKNQLSTKSEELEGFFT